jgi:hypothetical protein
MFIAAARSTDVPMTDNDPDGYHRIMTGTSMASPHVAGVVALMLQYAPSMTPDQVRSVLIQGTSLDAFTGLIEPSHGSNEWGWGKLDARTATVLFRVSFAVMLISAPSAVNFTLDREAHVSLAEGEVLTMRFQKGTVHTIELTEQTFTTNMTRYLVPYTKAVFSGNSIFAPDVRTQYLLSLESPIGEAEGGGWYDAGSYAGFSVQPLSVSGRVSGFLGLSYVFDHWIDERGNELSSGAILMGSPHSLTAEWSLEVTDWKPATLLGILVATLLVLAVRRKRNTRKKESEPYQ